MFNVDELKKALGVNIKDASLYELALTHPSCNGDAKTKHMDYERLEFIGDAVLGFVSGDLVFKLHPEMEEGLLTKLRSSLVKKEALAEYAKKKGLQKFIKVGHSISKDSLESSKKILEDVFEAIIGAIYLDLGIDGAYKYIEEILKDDILNVDIDSLTDYKSKIQEVMQADKETISYEIVDEKGPSHDKTFIAACKLNGIVLGTGEGKSKKEAEEKAAKAALEKGIL